jgi:hypothetical protein
MKMDRLKSGNIKHHKKIKIAQKNKNVKTFSSRFLLLKVKQDENA